MSLGAAFFMGTMWVLIIGTSVLSLLSIVKNQKSNE
jgi:hypothetical protein